MTRLVSIFFGLCFLILSGCTSLKQYEKNRPVLHLNSFFCGKTEGYGISFDSNGMPVTRFKIDAVGDCSVSGIVKIKQNITFENGRTEVKNIDISMVDKNKLMLSGMHIIDADYVDQYGNIAIMKYKEKIVRELETIETSFVEGLYMIDNNQIISKAKGKRFFLFPFGERVIIWRKV